MGSVKQRQKDYDLIRNKKCVALMGFESFKNDYQKI